MSDIPTTALDVVRGWPRATTTTHVLELSYRFPERRVADLLPYIRKARAEVLIEEAVAEFGRIYEQAGITCWMSDRQLGQPEPPRHTATPERIRQMAHLAGAVVAIAWRLSEGDTLWLQLRAIEAAQVTFGGRTYTGARGLWELNQVLTRVLRAA